MEKTVKKKFSRRDLIKGGSIGLAAAVLATVKTTQKASAFKGKKIKKRYIMIIDLRRCTGCHSCSIACKSEFQVPIGGFKSWVRVEEEGKFPDVKKYFLPRNCNHCLDSQCVSVCPTGASHVRDDGIVAINNKKCIGCAACVAACPYNCRFINKETHIADKCDFCLHRIENGIAPACVNTCPAEARKFGDLNDPDSEVLKLYKNNTTRVLKPELGTKPYLFYILPKGRTKLI